MRDHAVKLALLTMLGLVTPAAFAHPHHKAAGRPVAQTVPSAASRPPAKRHSAAARAALEPAAIKHPKVHTRKTAPQQTEPEVRAVATASQPRPVDPPLPEIHVNHNRKLHLKPGATPAPDQTPGPTGAQNSTAIPAPIAVVLPKPGEEPAPPTLKKVRLPRQIFPVVSVAPDPVPVLIPALYTRRGRLIMPPALKGSHEILLHQNEMADREGLVRILDDNDLERMRSSRMLVPIPVSSGLEVDQRLPANRRYTRPWTAQFLAAVGRAHYARFHSPLQVNSAVRTVEVQQHLLETNGNAAPTEGSTASPHLTGQAVDIAKHGLSMAEIAWLRGYLLPLVQQGKVDVEEEFQQSCFHISVYRQYVPQAAPKRVSTHRRSVSQVLAVALP